MSTPRLAIVQRNRHSLYSCSPPGHGNRQGVGHALGVFQVIERAGLLEVHRLDVLQHPADLDGLGRIVGAVGVGVDVDPVAQRLAGQGDERLGAAGHGVGVAAHAAAHAELDGLGARLVDQSCRYSTSCSGVVSRRPLAT